MSSRNRLATLFDHSSKAVLDFLRTDTFFRLIIGLFVLQAGWLAISITYPTLLDENYHVGIIHEYSKTVSPILASQPADSGELGDITRYGSYFYHYLMSFPYRLLDWVGMDLGSIVVALRFINIGIFVLIIIAFRKLLRSLKFSNVVANLSILFVTLLPSFILLGTTVNYDSLFILLAVVHLIYFMLILRKNYTLGNFAGLLLSGTLGSVTKYAFLPIIATTGLIILASIAVNQRKFRAEIKKHRKIDWKTTTLVVLVLLATGLFVERYVGNAVQYKSVQPDCSRLHSVDFCKEWGPWGRNYRLDNAYPDRPLSLSGAGKFLTSNWGPSMVTSSTVTGKAPDGALVYGSSTTIYGLMVLGCIGLFFYLVTIFTRSYRRLWPLHVVFLIYILALFMNNYIDYSQMGKVVAVQARYLFWVLPVIVALALVGLRTFLGASFKKTAHVTLIGCIVSLLVLSQYAGLMTYFSTYQEQRDVSKTHSTKFVNVALGKLARKIVVGE